MARKDLRPEVGWQERLAGWVSISRPVTIAGAPWCAHFVSNSVEALRLYRKAWTDHTDAYLASLGQEIAAGVTAARLVEILVHAGPQLRRMFDPTLDPAQDSGVSQLLDLLRAADPEEAEEMARAVSLGWAAKIPDRVIEASVSVAAPVTAEAPVGAAATPDGSGPPPLVANAGTAGLRPGVEEGRDLGVWTEEAVRKARFVTIRALARKINPSAATWGDILTVLVGRPMKAVEVPEAAKDVDGDKAPKVETPKVEPAQGETPKAGA